MLKGYGWSSTKKWRRRTRTDIDEGGSFPVPSIYSSAVPDLIPRHSPRQHPGMLLPFFRCLVSALKTRRDLALENLALRQQLAVLRRSVKRPRLPDFDRGFLVLLSRIWRDWKRSLPLVKPETVIRWHRSGFRRYWRWKSRRRRPGRPPIDPEVRALNPEDERSLPSVGSSSRTRRAA